MGTRIQFHNLILIATVLIVTSLAFHALSGRYLLNEARKQMKSDAEAIALSLKSSQVLSDRIVAERIANRAKLKIIGRAIDSRILILDKNNRLLYTNADQSDAQALRNWSRQHTEGYLVQRRDIRSDNGQLLGRMMLAIQIKDVKGLNRVLRGTQWASILIGGAIAAIMGVLLGRTITNPIRRLAAVMRNFSPRKQLPDMKIRSRDEIQGLADSFTEMADALQANDRMQTEFLQNASHELKTPLMTIQGNAEAVKDGIVQGKEAEQSLDLIVAECQRLKGVVDELIYMSRLDHEANTYRFEETRIGEVIGEALNRVQGLADQRGIELMLTGDLETEGRFDRDKLMRVFLNIVGNGIRYAKSQIRIEVKAAGNRLEILCADDGKGFASGEENKVFERFYKGEHGGTGIGLAIAKAIVEAHGGSIEATKGMPSGAVFRIRI